MKKIEGRSVRNGFKKGGTSGIKWIFGSIEKGKKEIAKRFEF